MDGTTAEIKMFAGNFAPRNWAFCQGQLLPIAQNTALFSIIGTIYGGDGRTTTALPDLAGRTAVHAGRGPGLREIRQGEKGGAETDTITQATMPSHSHTAVGAINAFTAGFAQLQTKPVGNHVPEVEVAPLFTSGSPDIGLNDASLEVTVGNTGSTQSHINMSPFLVLNYVICMQGIYPSRS